MLKVILVASGKGGTGKTSLTAGVGAALAQLGSKVLLIDGDCGLRNLDIVLGMSDRVVYLVCRCGRRRGSPRGCHGVSSGYENAVLTHCTGGASALSERGMEQLAVQAEEARFDYLLIDGPAGLPAELSFLAHIATQAIIVTSTDRGSVRGAERCARKLEEEYCIQRIRMVLNRVRPRSSSATANPATSTTRWTKQDFPCSVSCPRMWISFRAATAAGAFMPSSTRARLAPL